MMPAVRSLARRLLGLLVALALSASSLASVAQAADRIYWANTNNSIISFANLDGSGGADLNTGAATVSTPSGTTIDAGAGRIYWANQGAPIGIFFANLDGSGGASLNTSGASMTIPSGVAVDPVAGRIYWPDFSPGTISFANLDGTGGADLNTTGATVSNARGVAVDRAGSRVWWSNAAGASISFANLDGSGGGNLNTTGATVSNPRGVAIDRAAGKIYWANTSAGISFANLDGSGGGGNLNTTGATVDIARGVAIDAAAGRIYWANQGAANQISFANLDGSGGGNLGTGAATVNGPNFPSLLKAPTGAGPPAVTGRPAPGSTLTCSQGLWAADLLEAFLYRAPSSFGFQWSRGGTDIAGATASSYKPSAVANYRCTVTGSNEAGASSQTSAIRGVFRLGKLDRNEAKGTAKLTLRVPGPGQLVLKGKGLKKQRPVGSVGNASKTVKGAGKVKLLIKTKGKKRTKLAKTGKVKVNAKVTYTPTGGTLGTQTKKLKLIKR
jgi:DNA-binding beta-propeller fold protein YncE